MCPSLSPRGQGTSSPVSFEGFRGALYSSFTLGAHNFFLDQLRGVSLALSCQIPPKGNCSMWSYRFPNAIGFGRLEETVTYLSPSLWQFFRRTKWHSSSKIEVPFFHLLLEFSKKTKRFSFGKRLKVGCPETPKKTKILMTSDTWPVSYLHEIVSISWDLVGFQVCGRMRGRMNLSSWSNCHTNITLNSVATVSFLIEAIFIKLN